MKISVNTEHVLLNITGSFENIEANFVKIIIKFPLPNQNEFLCNIQHIQNNRF